MKASYIREQRHICGKTEADANYQEVDLFPITSKQHKASNRAKKQLACSMAQYYLNEKNSVRHFNQLAHTNFNENDFIVHLTYSDENLPQNEEEALRQLDLWIERVNYKRRKLGLSACKYLGVTEAKGKKSFRYHHHVIMGGGLPGKELKRLWAVGRGKNRKRLGGVKVDDLDFEGFGGTIGGLCAYIMKDPIGKRRWKQSKWLTQPKRPRPNDGKYSQLALAKMCKERLDDAEYWRMKYPGWELVETAKAVHTEHTGWSLYAKLRRQAHSRKRPKSKKGRKKHEAT